MKSLELHMISSGRREWGLLRETALLTYPLVTAIHIREKDCGVDELRRETLTMLEAGVPPEKLTLNGQPLLAWELGLGGIHLPGSSPPLSADIRQQGEGRPRSRVGVSIHSVEEARQRADEGADYLLFGHIWATGSKQGLPPRGIPQLREVAASVGIPVIAIGGVTPLRVPEILEAGGAGVAVMSGIWEAENPLHTVEAYLKRART